ncbi:cytosolic phospholipase A2 gamma-like isoform X1 [Engraulis encrasicolus]|uniref:cytosolic phospholipase A2 gamma-like isoform X1 n=1 Tax=Engraulis encrasicolus TaxID=184585 RepID=UPI002FD118F2
MCFEFSPNEVGFLDPGAYIQTPHLKMDFEGGRVSPKQPFKRQPINLAQLQGICSSFLADLVEVLDYLWHWIHSIRSDEDKHHPVFLLADLVLNHANTERSLSALEKLRSVFEDHGQFSQSLKEVNSEKWRDMAREGRTSFCHELVSSVGDLTSDLIQVDGTVDDVWWVIKHITPLLTCWTFGTVANFLYHFQDPAIPTEMSAKKQMHLIDGGLYLNSPYPSALRQARKIDLIISFDFGEDPFEALWKARDYAASNHLPFPELGSQPTRPKSFYVFEEEGKPTVIHIPLFNMDNCKDPEEIKRMTDEYKTFQVFRCEEKIDHLAYLAAKNVEMNKDKILQEIKKAAERCRAKC